MRAARGRTGPHVGATSALGANGYDGPWTDSGSEVADSSLRYDRTRKVPPYYARAGVPEAWLVDVEAGTVTVYTEPGLA